MKLKHTTTAVETNNVTEGNTFGIKSSPKTFAILSSGLYSDKIAAVVRELSCNAYDSHIERDNNIDAGKATKYTAPKSQNIRVHFPTSFDPYFSVRDFGIGLSPEDVENIYTVYFESTKQDSNDYVGALGLGSKSPFSYAQSFTVIATKNGHRVVYTMFINSQGIPQPAKLDEGPVESFYLPGEEIPEEEFYDGVEVKVPAEENDSSSFCDAAEYVFRFFKRCPDLVNYYGKEIKYYKDRPHVEEFIDGIYFGETGYRAKQYAIQGNVAYPIELKRNDFIRAVKDIDKFEDADKEEFRFTEEEVNILYDFYDNSLTNYQIYINFEIGDLDVAASREELSYDASTIMSIIVQINRIYQAISEQFDKHMEQFETKWDKAYELYRINENPDTTKERLFQRTGSPTKYLGENHIPQLQVDDSWGRKRLVYTTEYTTLPIPEEADFTIRTCGTNAYKRFFRLTYNKENPTRVHGFADYNKIPAMRDNLLIIVNDTDRGGATLAKAYLQEVSSKSRCILLEPDKLGEIAGIEEYITTSELKMDNPGLEVVYLSKVREEFPDLTKSTSRRKTNLGYYQLYDLYRSVERIYDSIPDSFAEEDTIVYIPFKQQKPADTGISYDAINALVDHPVESIERLMWILSKIQEILRDKMPTVIGLNQNMMKQVNDHDNWVSIDEFIVEQITDIFGTDDKKKKIQDKVVKKRMINDIHDEINWKLHTQTTNTVYSRLKEVNKDLDILPVLKIISGDRLYTTPQEELFEKFYNFEYNLTGANIIKQKYPMLLMIDRETSWDRLDEEQIQSIVNYCLLCNQGENNG